MVCLYANSSCKETDELALMWNHNGSDCDEEQTELASSHLEEERNSGQNDAETDMLFDTSDYEYASNSEPCHTTNTMGVLQVCNASSSTHLMGAACATAHASASIFSTACLTQPSTDLEILPNM
jgi:hypothetical protein